MEVWATEPKVAEKQQHLSWDVMLFQTKVVTTQSRKGMGLLWRWCRKWFRRFPRKIFLWILIMSIAMCQFMAITGSIWIWGVPRDFVLRLCPYFVTCTLFAMIAIEVETCEWRCIPQRSTHRVGGSDLSMSVTTGDYYTSWFTLIQQVMTMFELYYFRRKKWKAFKDTVWICFLDKWPIHILWEPLIQWQDVEILWRKGNTFYHCSESLIF